MELRDWKKLIDNIDWKNPLPVKDDGKDKRQKQYVIATILPDGSRIMYRNVAQTFIESIEAMGIEKFKSLELSSAMYPSFLNTLTQNMTSLNTLQIPDITL